MALIPTKRIPVLDFAKNNNKANLNSLLAAYLQLAY